MTERTFRLPGRWSPESLRFRVLIAVLAWVSLGIGGIWYSATRLFAKHVEDQYHEELAVHIRELAGLVRIEAGGRLSLIRPLSDPRYQQPLSGFYWQVSVAGGQRLVSESMTRGRLDEEVAHSPNILHHIEAGPTGPAITYGFASKTRDGQDVHYLIATDELLLKQVIGSFTRELTVWLTVLASLLAATGIAVVIYGFRPLDRLSRAVASLRRGDQSGLQGQFPSEIAPLVSDLTAYIEHSSAIVERGRVEAGALAHGLRTPLAIIVDEAERLSRRQDMAPSADVLLRQAQLMAQQIEFRLARARSAATRWLPGASSDLRETILPVLSAMQRLHPEISFELDADVPEGCPFPIDPVDLTELLSNLLDNAGKWACKRVVVGVDTGGPLSISIADDGAGLAPEHVARAFEIGTRFDDTRPGSGLGLAIARDIAEGYGLSLQLHPAAEGKPGLTATLSIQSE